MVKISLEMPRQALSEESWDLLLCSLFHLRSEVSHVCFLHEIHQILFERQNMHAALKDIFSLSGNANSSKPFHRVKDNC